MLIFVEVAVLGEATSAVGDGSSSGHDPKYEEARVKTQQAAGEKAAETGKEAKEGSESWAEWAKDKISEGLGLGTEKAKDTAKQASNAAMDAAKKTKEKVTDTASG